MLQRLRPATAKTQQTSEPERVAESITEGLLRREYSVGQRLIEADLTERLRVSRSTVREALKILASRGVVEIVQHRGATIRGLTSTEVGNLLDVLDVLIGLAARLAAEKIDLGDNRLRFRLAAEPLVKSDLPIDIDSALSERATFYQTMFDIADSEEVNRAMPTWRAHLFRNQFYAVLTKGDLGAMTGEFRQITGAVLAGDSVKAEKSARRHLQKTRERVMPYLR